MHDKMGAECDNCMLCIHACPITGIHAHAISGTAVQPVWLGGRIVGTVFEDEFARYCLLKDIHPNSTNQSRAAQATNVLELIEHALQRVDMTFANVVRKWLFCDDILAWYDDLNVARDVFFKEPGVFDRFVPASTGVGAATSSEPRSLQMHSPSRPKTGIADSSRCPRRSSAPPSSTAADSVVGLKW
jgi:hypothetical protein